MVKLEGVREKFSTCPTPHCTTQNRVKLESVREKFSICPTPSLHTIK
jgi:hypothetical protein